jgi:hypothetical protein
MITGVVTTAREARVRLTVRGPEGTVEAEQESAHPLTPHQSRYRRPYSGQTRNITIHQGSSSQPDILFFQTDHNNPPGCVNVNHPRWAVSLHKRFSRELFALILSAASQGRKVYVKGTGGCNYWSDSEDVEHVTVDYSDRCP